jgi:hypothetical protein
MGEMWWRCPQCHWLSEIPDPLPGKPAAVTLTTGADPMPSLARQRPLGEREDAAGHLPPKYAPNYTPLPSPPGSILHGDPGLSSLWRWLRRAKSWPVSILVIALLIIVVLIIIGALC